MLSFVCLWVLIPWWWYGEPHSASWAAGVDKYCTIKLYGCRFCRSWLDSCISGLLPILFLSSAPSGYTFQGEESNWTIIWLFFSVALVYFPDQNWTDQNDLLNLHIIWSLVHFIWSLVHFIWSLVHILWPLVIIKAKSNFSEQTANALAHSCKLLCAIVCRSLHYQLLMWCWSKCIILVLCLIPKTSRL